MCRVTVASTSRRIITVKLCHFSGTSLLMLAASIGKDWMLNHRLPQPTNLAFHGFFALMATLAIVSRKPRVHLFIALAMIVFSVAYVGLLFARLGQS